MKYSKEQMIDGICNRYLDLNAKDFEDGRIDAGVKEMCDNGVENFRTLLEGFSYEEVQSFFFLDRGVQIYVFSWHSGCVNALGFPKSGVEEIAKALDATMAKTGYCEIPIVKKIMYVSRGILDWLLSGDYKELGDGCGVYTFNN